VPALVCLLISAAATFASCWFLLHIVTAGKSLFGDNVPWPGWYYQWIFPPRVLWDVVAGIFVARLWMGRVSVRAALLASVLTALGAYLGVAQHAWPGSVPAPVREMAVSHLVDVPLSLALLGFFRFVPLPELVRQFLAWCGRRSWGLYLGHLLVHEIVQIAGFSPFTGAPGVRAAYALALLIAGAALVLCGAAVERRLRARLAFRSAAA
jgi:peptidoglycan/LPS O-acetylase OafA/YrhL